MSWLKNFPLHPFTGVVATVVFFIISIIASVRLAMGLVFPAGYDTFLAIVVAAMGVTGAVSIGQRLTDYGYAQIKAGATPSTVVAGGPTTVEVKPDEDKVKP